MEQGQGRNGMGFGCDDDENNDENKKREKKKRRKAGTIRFMICI